MAPFDADYRYCGLDDEVKDYPYIYYAAQLQFNYTTFKIDIVLTPVCAKECPLGPDEPVDCYGAGPDPGKVGTVTAEDCKTVAPASETAHFGYTTMPLFGKYCLQNGTELADSGNDFSKYTTLVGDFGLGNIVEPYDAIKQAKWAYAYTVLTCFVFAITFMVLMRFFTAILVWVSLFVAGLSLLAMALLLQNYHHEFWGDDGVDGTLNPVNILGKSETVGDVLQGFVYFLYGMTGLYFLIMLCLVR